MQKIHCVTDDSVFVFDYVNIKFVTEQPLTYNAPGAFKIRILPSIDKKNLGQKPKKELGPMVSHRARALGAPWATRFFFRLLASVLFAAFGPGSFFCFGLRIYFRLDVFSASRYFQND